MSDLETDDALSEWSSAQSRVDRVGEEEQFYEDVAELTTTPGVYLLHRQRSERVEEFFHRLA